MNTAKEKYYLSGYSNQSIVIDYVTELETELTKLKESQTQKSIIKLCNRVDKAEAESERPFSWRHENGLYRQRC